MGAGGNQHRCQYWRGQWRSWGACIPVSSASWAGFSESQSEVCEQATTHPRGQKPAPNRTCTQCDVNASGVHGWCSALPLDKHPYLVPCTAPLHHHPLLDKGRSQFKAIPLIIAIWMG
jgi:hypothetical protein